LCPAGEKEPLEMWYKVLLVVIGFGIAFFSIFFPDYTRMKLLEEENEELSRQVATLKQDIATLGHDLEQFKTDPFYVEKVAREEFGIARENEVIVHVEAPEKDRIIDE
jgi:cell division protein FtsB